MVSNSYSLPQVVYYQITCNLGTQIIRTHTHFVIHYHYNSACRFQPAQALTFEAHIYLCSIGLELIHLVLKILTL